MKLGLTFLWLVGLTLGGVGTPLRAQQTGSSPTAPASASSRTVWDGVYTLNQAKRGALKSGLCTQCHGDNFEGGPAPQLGGEDFMARWSGRTVGDLFDVIRLTMPDDDPGALRREEYADLVAYILAVNKLPTGTGEIGTQTEPLKLIRIDESKP